MKSTTRITIALLVSSAAAIAHADDQRGALLDIAKNVSGYATINSQLGSATASFGGSSPNPSSAVASVSGTPLGGLDMGGARTGAAFSLQAASSADGEMNISSRWSGYLDQPLTNTTVTGTLNWTGTLVNTTGATESLSVISLSPYDPSQNGYTATYSALLNGRPITSTSTDIIGHPIYSLGNLAAGQSATFSYTASVTGLGALFDQTYGSDHRSGAFDASLLDYDVKSVAAVPEPATTALMFAGLGCLAIVHRRKAKKQSAPTAA